MKQRHRIFIAINLPGDIKKFLGGFQKKWSELPAKWTSLDNLHITVTFLGDVTDIELGEVCVVVKDVVKKHHSFDVHLHKISYGPDNKIPPRMLWVEGQKSNELSLLKRELESALLEKVKFAPDIKIFNPHIKLARIRAFGWRAIEPEERPEVTLSIDVAFTVESIDVMESELKKGGPQYTIIESHVLGS